MSVNYSGIAEWLWNVRSVQSCVVVRLFYETRVSSRFRLINKRIDKRDRERDKLCVRMANISRFANGALTRA